MHVMSHLTRIGFLAVLCLGVAFGSLPRPAIAQEDEVVEDLSRLILLAWEASGRGDHAYVEEIVQHVLDRYGVAADTQAGGLQAFPARDEVQGYEVMNQVGTSLFIRAEAIMHQGRTRDAIAAFEEAIARFPFSQAWDPSRGSYWSIAEKSRESIKRMTGEDEKDQGSEKPRSVPRIFKPGTDKIIDYAQYGTIEGAGTKKYKFKVNNPNVLSRAVGEGIYPNTADILQNPRYREVLKEKRLEGSHWDFANTPDLEAAYFKWAMAPEHWGVKLFFIGLTLEKAGMNLEAIKAYHALIVHFPNTVAWTYWQTPWYPAQAAVAKIKNILRMHPELELVYEKGSVQVLNGTDNDVKNDVFVVNPGAIKVDASAVHKRHRDLKAVARSLGRPKRILGGRKTRLVQYNNGHWQLFTDNEAFMIHGVTYAPTKVGQSPDKGNLANWMTEDTNGNGRADGPFDSWVDANRNDEQDPDEPVVGDFQLMKEMGVNTLRIYDEQSKIDKTILREMFERFGMRVIVGSFVGKYAIGSGASWAEGTDYGDPQHRANLMRRIEAMVQEYKDEPYVLFWLLGNENNYGVASNADKKPVEYYTFINDVAKRIKEIDPTRPVAICNGDIIQMDYVAKYAPLIDIYGANIYRGDYGFGAFWDDVRRVLDRPAFITEYGAPAFAKGFDLMEAEEAQGRYHRGNWLDIEYNSAGHDDGAGNSVGGVVFEWLDEWWKNYEPTLHDKKADVIGPFAGGYYFEEWFGIVGQGNGRNSPFMRQLRKAYFVYEELWNRRKR
ncbi:MAG: tetratricopeptide repeat protein [Elusimicrobia bacterium]|nr:tetratricopeptide repeat protein [Elusimicrobiota bacterium]